MRWPGDPCRPVVSRWLTERHLDRRCAPPGKGLLPRIGALYASPRRRRSHRRIALRDSRRGSDDRTSSRGSPRPADAATRARRRDGCRGSRPPSSGRGDPGRPRSPCGCVRGARRPRGSERSRAAPRSLGLPPAGSRRIRQRHPGERPNNRIEFQSPRFAGISCSPPTDSEGSTNVWKPQPAGAPATQSGQGEDGSATGGPGRRPLLGLRAAESLGALVDVRLDS